MSGLDDRIREGLEQLARPADGSALLDRVARRKRRYRVVRRVQAATLTLAVVAGSAAGVWGLTRAFDLGGAARPAVPGDANGLIAFSAETDSGWDIFVVEPDGTGGFRALVAGPYDEIHPVWSPDGARIAFVKETEEISTLHVMNADGTEERELYLYEGGLSPPAWSPEGGRIGVADSSGRLLVLSSEGNLIDLREAAAGRGLDWSPDGSQIAYAGEGHLSIWDLGADEVSQLTEVTPRLASPAWSPDGSWIAFTNDDFHGPGCPVKVDQVGAHDLHLGVHIVEVGTREITSLSGRGCHLAPAWSPDGSRIAYWSGGEPDGGVAITDPFSEPRRPHLIESDAEHGAFAWSPDGSLIAYAAEGALMMAPAEGGPSTEIVSGFAPIGDISWQPSPADVEPVPGPTSTPSPIFAPTPGPTPPLEPCGSGAIPCHDLVQLLDRAGYDAEGPAGSPVLGISRFVEGSPLRVWTTDAPCCEQTPARPGNEGERCLDGYWPVGAIERVLICTYGGSELVWRSGSEWIHVEGLPEARADFMGSRQIEPLVRASLVAGHAEAPARIAPPVHAEITSLAGTQQAIPEAYCWSEPPETCGNAADQWPPVPLALERGERIRVQIVLGDQPPDRATLSFERGGSPAYADHLDRPALSNSWDVKVGHGTWRSRFCGEWDGHGTVCWRFLLAVTE